MAKSADAFRTISEVAEWLGVQTHVLRFWESKFTQVKPVKRAGGRRYYRPSDMLLLGGIRKLLHDDGLTIKGVQKILREEGMAYVADLSPPLDAETDAQLDADLAARIDEDVTPPPVEADVLPFESTQDPAPAYVASDDDDIADVDEPEAAATDAPLPSFLRTQAPEAGAETSDADDQPGLPYPPLVEDAPAQDEEQADADAPALTDDIAEPAPATEEQVLTPASDAAKPDDADVPAEAEAAKLNSAETQTEDEATEDTEAEPAATLPSFLSDYAEPATADEDSVVAQAEEAEPIAATPKPKIVNVPDDPNPETILAAPSALSKAAGLTHLSDAQRNMIRPLLTQLTALRDQMASNRRDPR
ncbi:MerR family transcriptional regulator [uncultured Tateyamaria sp.]|uniref:MerR family transcriptional regulator n=1 Tax=uncultured Tateyamaria sp. TaxID=455651 RepID=UPI002609A9FD|nr:MerR family transcriptional regulator [uncultured Tateyamaria sp.]